MSFPLPASLPLRASSLASLRAFDPNQRRDEHGRWADFGGIFDDVEFVIGKIHSLESGELGLIADGRDSQIGFKTKDGKVAGSGLLDDAAMRDLAKIIEERVTHHGEESPKSGKWHVASYPKYEDGSTNPHDKPNGYVELRTQDHGESFDIELLDSDEVFHLSRDELVASELSYDARRYTAAKTIVSSYGPLETFISNDDQYTFRMADENGDPASVEFDVNSWRAVRLALDFVIDGFDQESDEEAASDEDIKTRYVKTNAGKVKVVRTGTNTHFGTLKILPVDETKHKWGIYISEDDYETEAKRDVLNQFRAMDIIAQDIGLYDPDDGAEQGKLRKRITTAQGGLTMPRARERASALLARTEAHEGRSWYRFVRNQADANTAELYIYDEIGFWGVGASAFVADLNDTQAGSLTLRINSPGGEIFDGVTIYNALARWAQEHNAPVNVIVDGLAASAASFIAMAGTKITMMPASMMMIHDGAGICVGNAGDMRQLADLLDQLSANIAGIYATRGTADAATWRAAMLAETWYSAEEAVAAGLADEVAAAPARTGEGSTGAATARRVPKSDFDLSIFKYAGRNAAPAPLLPETDQRVEPAAPAPVPDAWAEMIAPLLEPAAAQRPMPRLTPSVQDLLDALREGQ